MSHDIYIYKEIKQTEIHQSFPPPKIYAIQYTPANPSKYGFSEIEVTIIIIYFYPTAWTDQSAMLSKILPGI